MIEYKLIAATDVGTFSSLMVEALNDRWEAQGSLVVTPHSDFHGYGMQYTQAVLRRLNQPAPHLEPMGEISY